MTKDILVELIEFLDIYESEARATKANPNMNDFVGFLNSRFVPENVSTRKKGGDVNVEEFSENNGHNTDISILIVLMFRYAKSYIKKALKDSSIKTADEFSFLITLLTYESMSKTELIHNQIMEKTSGTEIINRLVKLGFIEQFDDLEDKRSIRIKITATGKSELMKILPQMRTVSQIVTGNLVEPEKAILAYILRKLDHYHNDIFINKRDAELNDLI